MALSPTESAGLPRTPVVPTAAIEGAPPDAHTGGRRGGIRTTKAGVVDLGHRPPPGPRSKDGPGLPRRRSPGRRPAVPDHFAPFEPYARERLREDPHLWATALHDELRALGYGRSYQVLTRELRRRALRPHCEPCAGVRGRATIEIAHPPGEEIQWDWLELPGAPWAAEAHLLVGTLSHSAKCRAVFCESEDQAHLIEAIDGVLRRLGGTARRWRTDRMATVCDPGSGRLHPSPGRTPWPSC